MEYAALYPTQHIDLTLLLCFPETNYTFHMQYRILLTLRRVAWIVSPFKFFLLV